MKLGDRIWLWRNKKPPTRHSRYSALAFCWLFAGIMLSVAAQNAILWVGSIRAKSEYSGDWGILFGITLALFILMCLVVYFADRRQGYLDAIYRHHLERWRERWERISGKK